MVIAFSTTGVELHCMVCYGVGGGGGGGGGSSNKVVVIE